MPQERELGRERSLSGPTTAERYRAWPLLDWACAPMQRHHSKPERMPVVAVVETPSSLEKPAMSVKTMEDLFVATLKDIYYAEKQILKALPAMVKKANGDDLRKALETHRKETEGQVDRLDKVFKLIDVPARGKKCEAIEGIIDEAKEHMEEIENEDVLDAGMISSAQAVEHYEICRYGTLIEWAKDLGHDDAVALLQQNLDEEKHADSLLSRIAKTSSNARAMAAAE
jgi:ferritin-like metal-binding protein YciE